MGYKCFKVWGGTQCNDTCNRVALCLHTWCNLSPWARAHVRLSELHLPCCWPRGTRSLGPRLALILFYHSAPEMLCPMLSSDFCHFWGRNQARSQSPRSFWSAPRFGTRRVRVVSTDQNVLGLWKRDWLRHIVKVKSCAQYCVPCWIAPCVLAVR